MHEIRSRAIAGLALAVAPWLATSGMSACTAEDHGIIEIADAVTEPGFGTPCTSDDDCTQRVCVPHIANTVCSQACDPTHPCPDDWSCWTPPARAGEDDGRPASYCVSPFWALCRPCSGDSACASIASEDPGSCVDYLGAGAFCATACNDDSACPDGFSCSEVETLGGATARRCINTTGMCPCTPYLERLGEPTRCTKADDWGECVGQRTCADGLWSACDARDAAPDVENGQDDDCDGQTDELACACGDDVCDGACGETTANCPCDCAVEGDGVCSPCGESPLTSPTDCCKSPSGTTGCGDGFCMGFGCGESPANCPDDCGHACGDDVCEPGESPYTCPDDCAHKVCGNHVCESTDGGPDKCPQDCDAFCGDCVCDPARDEAVFNCPIDCGYCGDGDCSLCAVLHETEATCASDCCVPSPEFCNGEDEDCDGQTDEEGAIGCHDFYRDADGDGLGARGETRCLCAPDGAWSATAAGDCDDGDHAIGAGPAEVCNGEDDDCDGETDEGFDLGVACAAPSGPCTRGRTACDGPDRTACVDAGPADAGTLCSPLGCSDGLITPPGICDGGGACVHLPLAACDGFACTADGRCKSVCDGPSDCRSGWACGITGVCEQVAPDCSGDGDCIDQDWHTADVCVTTCGHPPRDDVDAGDDTDGDTVPNGLDVCPETIDPDQADSDHDGRGDACDACGGPGQLERCNGVDDDCDGQTDEGFDVGVSCRSSATSCDAGVIQCAPDGTAHCVAHGAAPAGIVCGQAACAGDGVTLEARCDGTGHCAPGAHIDCHGYACSATSVPAGAACGASCDGPEDCQSGFWCGSGACIPERPPGAACGADDQCASGTCVDGVCCTTPCDGPCQACGQDGVCAPAVPGTDPDGECDACATCGASGECTLAAAGTDPKGACEPVAGSVCGPTGACDGSGGCAFAQAGSVCSDTRCLDGKVADAFVCDGGGSCQGAAAVACPDGLGCASDGSACLAACGADRDCVASRWCDLASGHCPPLVPLGQACTTDRACASGVCVDGVCCDKACDGGCETCAAAGNPGHCTPRARDTDPEDACDDCLACDGAGACAPVDAATDPLGDCPDDAAVCGRTGLCDGLGACAFDDSGVRCGVARCVGDTSVSSRACSGQGSCADATLTACLGVHCDPATGLCKATCANNGDCQSGYYCAADKSCKALAAQGAGCGVNGECATGYCTDGVCCERPCSGACMACAAGTGLCGPTSEGGEEAACQGIYHCEAGACVKDDGVSCAAPGECGSDICAGGVCCATACGGTCQTCAGGTCATADHAQVPGRCEGSNWCVAGACVAISGSSCGAGGSCPSGLVCHSGTCGAPAALGTGCNGDGECQSGHCTDHVCCESTCGEACHACGASGRCDPIASSGGETPGECGAGLGCSADGACKLPVGATCGGDAACASGHCPDGKCCDVACDGVCESCATGTCLGVSGALPGEGCQSGEVCVGRGDCGRIAGQICDAATDCTSLTCIFLSGTLGFCCDVPCTGPCQTCSASDPLGTCQIVTSAENPGRCESDKWCDISGQCRLKAGQTCTTDGGCGPGTFCDLTAATPTCQPKGAIGASCARDAACAGGACADGTCCDSPCDGACEVCDLPTSIGHCALAATGTDPHDDCPADETCSREQGGCALSDGEACGGDSECAHDACVGSVCCDRACDGLCESCDTGVCGAVTNQSSDLCAGNFACDAMGACRQAAGTPCDAGADCASDHCDSATGRCCPSGCIGTCQQCRSDGTCASVTQATVPGRCDGGQWCDASGVCGPVLGATCVGDGDCQAGLWCDRQAGHPTGLCSPRVAAGASCARDAACATGFCVAGLCCDDACDGACETCARPGHEGQCWPAAAGDDPGERCGAGQACSAAGTCLVDLGKPCGTDIGCASGNCEQGVCCGAPCDGACARCNEPGHEGECRPVASGASGSCQAPFTCDNGACLLADGQLCASPAQCASDICAGGTIATTNVCCATACNGVCRGCSFGSGACDPLLRQEDPGLCSGASWCDKTGACRLKEGSPCTATSDCAAGATCDVSAGPGVCRTPLGPGQDCSSDAQCLTGICSQGKCCTQRCDAACGSCGTGVCTLPAAGTDPLGRCAGGKKCAADGSCQDPNGAGCSVGGSCATGLCVDGRCCNSSCTTPCQTCNRADALGFCSPLASGEDSGCSGPAVECHNGICAGDIGTPCGGPVDCASTSCSDNVCCDASCTGVCKACNQPGQVGHCATLARVEDGGCAGSLWCNKDGSCSAKTGSPCGGDADCPSPTHTCVTGTCQPRGNSGASCDVDGDCLSGYCTDGVCCVERCDGQCARCDATPGLCTGVFSGSDTTCTGAFRCAGRDRCLLDDGEPCGSPSVCASNLCLDDVCCQTGCGVCQGCAEPGSEGQCAPLDHVEASGCVGLNWCVGGSCAPKQGQACIDSNDCDTGFFCDGVSGTCMPRRGLGDTCDYGALDECAEGSCVDGVCCSSLCEGSCQSCDQPGFRGTCHALPDGFDDCSVEGQSCRDGECRSGLGSDCAGDGECQSGLCVDQHCCAADCDAMACQRCDGSGQCVGVASGEDGACSGPLYECSFGECKLDLGVPCGLDGECASGACVDGVCCSGGCGACDICNAPGNAGHCTAVSGQETAMCQNPNWCDIHGNCAPPGEAQCLGDGDCPGGYHCGGDGKCTNVVGAGLGTTCAMPSECASGYCKDSVCCDAPCDGTCMVCNDGAHLGQCSVVAGGSDLDSCPSGSCDATGSCTVTAGSCLGDGECPGGFCDSVAGKCQSKRPPTAPCDRPEQCMSGICNIVCL